VKIEGRVVLVAGGGSGLGRAVCVDLAERGATVAVLDRDGDAAERVAKSLGERAVSLDADVVDGAAVELAVQRTIDHFGAVHINVNTAGISDGAKVVRDGEPAALAHFERVVAVNLIGTFNVMRVAIAAMLRNQPDENGERGVVINTSSGAAYDGQVGQAAYSASKAGVIGMTLPVARDLAGAGVRVNAVAPGLFNTPMAGGLPQRVRDSLLESILEPGRLGEPPEFAALVRHLVENPYMNAECVRIDAGTRLRPR
jgi:3-hydroxyacyl-CoA dehydrogenase/3-hydroxy-2-methylbutyryl-CoA dehydrogenase